MMPKPNPMWYATRLYDDTPRVVLQNVVGTRQRLLTQVRYNRLVDRFFGTTAYSLGSWIGKRGKSHFVVDEIYVAVDGRGRQFVVPLLAKGEKNPYDVVRTAEDLAWCQTKMTKLICRPISVQFVTSTKIAMLALDVCDDEILVAEERHYELVPAKSVTEEDLKNYSLAAQSENRG